MPATLPPTRGDISGLQRPMVSVVTHATREVRGQIAGADSWSDAARRILDPPRGISPQRRRTMTQRVNEAQLRHRTRFARAYSRFGVGTPAPLPDAVIRRMTDDALHYSGKLPDLLVTKLRGRIARAQEKGVPFSRQELERLTRESVTIARNHARLVGHDQAINVVGEANARRQIGAGAGRYRWRTMRDDRVRDTHRAQEGTIQRWDRPPSRTGHPGNEINCRCVAEPIFPPRRRRRRS